MAVAVTVRGVDRSTGSLGLHVTGYTIDANSSATGVGLEITIERFYGNRSSGVRIPLTF